MQQGYSICLIFLSVSLVLISSASSYSQIYNCTADYNINARLDTLEHAVVGTEIVTWHNNSLSPALEIYFHLYLNAFSNSMTTFMKESGLNLSETSPGWIRIESIINRQSKEEISKRFRFVQPDDQNVFDSTVAVLSLDKPVKSNDSISFEIQFYAKLPRAISKSGWVSGTQLYIAAHWFPKICVFENGTWNCHQVHAFTKSFSDFGNYNVRITVPSGFIVGATGESTGDELNADGTVSRTFVANNVNDFAWLASPTFIVINHTFSYPGLKKLVIRILLQPNHRMLEKRYLDAIDTALRFFGSWFGPYPYGTLTIVDLPRTASVVQAEYPALIAVCTGDYPMKNYLSLESTIIHQYAHEYWHCIVANNGYEHPWLDEGISSLCADKVIELVYGQGAATYRIASVYPVRLFPLCQFDGFPVAAIIGDIWISPQYKGLQLYLENARRDAISEWGFHAFDRASYAVMACIKPELVLGTLEGYISEKVMMNVLRTYFERFQYKHPRPSDFEDLCNQISGKRLDWFFSDFIDGTGIIDYEVKSVDYFRETDLSTNVTSYVVKVVIVKNGTASIPVDVRLGLEDGTVIDTTWDGVGGWKALKFVVHSIPEFAQVDPFDRILLDINYSNNSYVLDLDLKGIIYWINQMVSYAQNLLFNFISII